MRGKVSELNAKTHLRTKLNLTQATLDNMGIAQAHRLEKNPRKRQWSMPPSDNYLYHNRCGRNCTKCSKRRRTGGKNFKDHIPEAYAKVYSYYIKVGIFLKESQQLNYRLRFEEHTLQLQIKKTIIWPVYNHKGMVTKSSHRHTHRSRGTERWWYHRTNRGGHKKNNPHTGRHRSGP